MHTTKECVISNTNNSKVAGVCSECTTARATRALLKELPKRKLQMCYMPLKFISWISTVHFLCASPYKRRIIILGCLKLIREIRGHFLVTWDLIFVCTVSWAASINEGLRKGDSNMLFIPWFFNAYPCWSCYNLTHVRTLKKWQVLSCIQIACQTIKYVIYNWTDTLCLFPFSGKNRSCLFRTTYKEVFQSCIVPLDCSNFMFCLRYF